MRRWTRIALAALGGLILLVLLVALLVPRLISLDSVRDTIVAQLSQRLGVPITIGTLRASLLPLPHVVARDVTVTIPDKADVHLPKVSIRPRIMSLIRRHPEISSIEI